MYWLLALLVVSLLLYPLLVHGQKPPEVVKEEPVTYLETKLPINYEPPVKKTPLVDRIIACESGGNPLAKNKNSTAKGLGQFLDSTWRHYSILRWGEVKDVYDPVLNRELIEWVIENYGTGDWEADPTSYACWK